MPTNDLYATLGVSKSASTAEIKKAYRKLARRYHPDVNPGSKASEEKFKQISEAHDILSDTEKRKAYDEFGMESLRAGFDPGQARAYEQFRARQGAQEQPSGGFGGYGRFEDILGDLFGESARPGPQPGLDSEAEVELDFLDAVRGVSRDISIDRSESCSACGGTGNDPTAESQCTECLGKGRVQVGQGPVAFSRPCPRCGGSGRISTRSCQTCGGRGHTTKRERLHVRIPAGVDTGSRVRVAGKGLPGRAGGPPGDLYLVIRVRPHPLLERRGDDLHLDVPITVGEGVYGSTITVPTPSGDVRLKVPAGSQSGKLLRMRGRGVAALKGGGSGDLYVRLMVQVPSDESEKLRDAVQAIDAAYEGDLRVGLRL
jgi:molecular chaperone DnaJ